MKALVTLFLAIVIFGIAWGYTPPEAREAVKLTIRKNLLPIVFGIVAVAVALFVSTNSTLRLV